MKAAYKEQKSTVYNAFDWMTAEQYLKHIMSGRERTQEDMNFARFHLTKQFLDSPVFAIRNFMYTIDKATKRDVLCDPFIGQVMLDKAIEQQRRARMRQRVVEIKPRKVGWTTWNLGRGLQASMHPNTNVLVCIDDADVVQNIMLQVSQFYTNLPGWMKPDTRIENLVSLVFENPDSKSRQIRPGLNSSFVVTVPAEMRGVRAPNVAIMSELAHYKDAGEVLDALQSGMGEHEETCIIIDTTPRGFDDYYYPMVFEAVKRNPNLRKFWERNTIPSREEVINSTFGLADDPSDYIPVFCAWFWHEEYTTRDDEREGGHPRGHLPKMTKAQREELIETLGKRREYGGDEEIELRDRFNVGLPRLFWRRKKIDGYIGSDWRRKLVTFRQEFASTWDGCFVDYGDTPFDPEGLEQIRAQLREPLAWGIMEPYSPNPGDESLPVVPTLKRGYRSDWEEVRIYSNSLPGKRYIAGIDVASAFESKKADFSVCSIILPHRNCCYDPKELQRVTCGVYYELVAVYQAKVPPHRLKEQIFLLYKFYNNMLLAIETAHTGYSLCRDLFDMGADNQYRYKRLDEDILNPDSKWLGWESNFRTRPTMEDALTEVIGHKGRDGAADVLIRMPDKQTFAEIASLKRYPEGGIAAQGKGHDDHADALMIALAVAKEGSYRAPKTRHQEQREMNSLWKHMSGPHDEGGGRNHPRWKDL